MNLASRLEAAEKEAADLRSKVSRAKKSKTDSDFGTILKNNTSAATVVIPPLRSVKARRTLKGHFGKVTALHWSGDSQTLVSASQDGNLIFWNALTSNKIQAVALKSNYVMAVGIEQERGELVACGGLDNLCTIYKRTNIPVIRKELVELAKCHDGFISCCRFVDQSHVVTSSGDSRCIYWDIQQNKPISIMAEHTSDAMYVDMQPSSSEGQNNGNHNIFASCSVDGSVKIWDLRTPEKSVQTFAGHHVGDVNCVTFLRSDPNALISCGIDQTIRLFDMRAYNQLACFGNGAVDNNNNNNDNNNSSMDFGNDGYTCCAASSSGRLFFAGHSNGTVMAFDVTSAATNTTSPVFSMSNAHDRTVSCMGVTPDGTAMSSGSWDSLLKVWA